MKNFNVFLFDNTPVPLQRDTELRISKIEYFDEEDKAVEFAKSMRHKWPRVTVHRTKDNEEIVSFDGDDMYIGDKRTRLSEDE